jgi:hypothetical protein
VISLPSIPLRLVTTLVTVALYSPDDRIIGDRFGDGVNPASISFTRFFCFGLLADCSLKVRFSLLSGFINVSLLDDPMALEHCIGFVTDDPADRCARYAGQSMFRAPRLRKS